MLEHGCEHIEAPTPVLITVLDALNEPRYPTVAGMLDATSPRSPIEVWNAADLGAKVQDLGLMGSLTQVTKTFAPKRPGAPNTLKDHRPP